MRCGHKDSCRCNHTVEDVESCKERNRNLELKDTTTRTVQSARGPRNRPVQVVEKLSAQFLDIVGCISAIGREPRPRRRESEKYHCYGTEPYLRSAAMVKPPHEYSLTASAVAFYAAHEIIRPHETQKEGWGASEGTLYTSRSHWTRRETEARRERAFIISNDDTWRDGASGKIKKAPANGWNNATRDGHQVIRNDIT
ncbi:hypothetical protein IW262DRAFT_1299829 [Armillaria fumosa]|nr:hypothetical protein IW262DRAFT_1299829 [Armillaria fumosa]